MENVIKLAHGDGGKQTSELIEELFYPSFQNDLLLQGQDATCFQLEDKKFFFTTDSFVVKPIFFKGGNIGKLAVCGTVNDLIVSGATPLYLSAGFIIEEGFEKSKLTRIIETMEEMCDKARVQIITGDTKVVEKGSVDGIYINTSGIGMNHYNYTNKMIEPEDKIIVTGGIGEHGTTIAVERYGMKINGDYQSDCALLTPFLSVIQEFGNTIKIMRDPTRGGLATTLHEFSKLSQLSIRLIQDSIPINSSIHAMNQLLGFDPLYMACEGRMVLVVKKEEANKLLEAIQSIPDGREANIIGEFLEREHRVVYSENAFGGKRIIGELTGIMLPRIC